MKMKLSIKIILIIAFLASITSITLEKRKISRRKIPSSSEDNFQTPSFSLLAWMTGDSYKVQTVKKYAELIDKKEKLEELFAANLLQICKSLMESSALNAQLIVQFKIKMEKLKQNLNLKDFEPIQEDPEKLKNKLLLIIKKHKDGSQTDHTHHQVSHVHHQTDHSQYYERSKSVDLANDLMNGFMAKFMKIEKIIENVIKAETEMKNRICFGDENRSIFFEQNKETFGKINEIMEELEETSDFIEIFKSNGEERQIWLEKALKYDPIEGSSIKKNLKSISKFRRFSKGCLSFIQIFLPVALKKVALAIEIYQIVDDIANGKSAKEIFLKIFEIVKDHLEEHAVKILFKTVFGKFAYLASIVEYGIMQTYSTVKSAKKFGEVEDYAGLNAVLAEMQQMSLFQLKSMQAVKSSHTSILVYKILKDLLKLETKMRKNSQVRYGIDKVKDLCQENYHACAIEMGISFLREYFSEKQVCVKDIFLTENSDSLKPLKMVKTSISDEHLIKDMKISWNYFFSLSDSFVVNLTLDQKVNLDQKKIEIINIIKSNPIYNQANCAGIEEQLITNKLNFGEGNLYIFKLPRSFFNRCQAASSTFCGSLNEILLFDYEYSVNTNSYASITQESDVTTNFLLKKVCNSSKKPFKSFSDKEEKEILRLIKGVLSKGIIKQNLSQNKNEFIYEGELEEFLKLRQTHSKLLKINFVDALLILHDMVVYDKLITINSSNKIYVQLFMSQMKRRDVPDLSLFNQYSSGNAKCIHHQLIRGSGKSTQKRTANFDYIQLLKANNLKPTAEIIDSNEKSINYLTDLYSRLEDKKSNFYVNLLSKSITYRFSSLLNNNVFKFDLEKGRLDLQDEHANYDDCFFTFQFAKINVVQPENQSNSGLTFSFLDKNDKLGLPLLKISKGKTGEIVFSNRFYILVYSDSDDITDEGRRNRNNLYKTISKKLTKFGYYGLIDSGLDKKICVNHSRCFIDFNQGNVRFEVFLKPFETREEIETDSICQED